MWSDVSPSTEMSGAEEEEEVEEEEEGEGVKERE